MKIRLIWVGKTRERFIREGIEKYLALLKPSADIEIIEVKEEKTKDARTMIEREGERILKLRSPYILLDQAGEQVDSIAFSRILAAQRPSVSFVLGGAYGVTDAVRQRAERTVALSRMTFTHEMSRMILIEQLYRAFSIQQKRGYHH